MSFSESRKRSLTIENLEAKTLLAGDVLVGVVGGNLSITGDEMDNQISIESGPERGQYIVHGWGDTNVILINQRPAGLEPSSTDGGDGDEPASNRVVVDGVNRGAQIRMADGNDDLSIENARFAGNVLINMGKGSDNVSVGDQLIHTNQPSAENFSNVSIILPGAEIKGGDADSVDKTPTEGPQRPARPELPAGHQRPERPELPEGHQRPERPELPEGHQRPARPELPEGHQRPARPELPAGHQRPERPEGPAASRTSRRPAASRAS